MAGDAVDAVALAAAGGSAAAHLYVRDVTASDRAASTRDGTQLREGLRPHRHFVRRSIGERRGERERAIGDCSKVVDPVVLQHQHAGHESGDRSAHRIGGRLVAAAAARGALSFVLSAGSTIPPHPMVTPIAASNATRPAI